MGDIVGITGSPGTGKKTISPIAAKLLKLRCVSLNGLASAYHLLSPGDPNGEVDIREMRKRIAREISHPTLLYGHLLPYAVPADAVKRVVVLRCEPSVLKERLVRRGYQSRKMTENLEAELIGLISADAFATFGSSRTFEVDTTIESPAEAAHDVAKILLGAPGGSRRIDWTVNYDTGSKLRSLLSAA